MRTITDTQIRALMAEAGEAGDHEQVVLCLTALDEDDGRFPEVRRVIPSYARDLCRHAIARNHHQIAEDIR